MPTGRHLNRTSGFTIVEVLVVIAIIGILSGILLPIFLSAKESVRTSKCQSNLKQLYFAFKLYADEWSGVLPCGGGCKGDRSYWAQEGGGGIDAYLKNRRKSGQSVYDCPSYTGEYKSEWSARTYSMNSYLRNPWDHPGPGCTHIMRGIREANIPEPARTILIYEGMPEDWTNDRGEGYVYRCGDWTLVRGYCKLPHYQESDRPWHRGRNNYLFSDGHIELRVPERYPAFRGGPTSPENDLWHVNKDAFFKRYQ
jgi:prepilin-type N-terminal cleavage/methylation domain-containing protein/prepilin-type processing-associated H-X9-DG protein